MRDLIDTHFHLDFYKNHKQVYKKINELHQYTLCMTNSPEIYQECQKLYFNTKYIKFALGFNPKANNSRNSFTNFINIFKGAEYIGEVGLDFSKKYKDKIEEQKQYFDIIVQLCSNKNKLLSVHIRNAEDSAIQIMEKYKPKKCIIHWFTGNENQIKKLIDLGCYFSINANMISSTNKNLLLLIPKDKILIESDGPFTNVNGKKYEPTLLKQQYNIISNFFNEPELTEIVYRNFNNILTIE